jgi:hypothetical protein
MEASDVARVAAALSPTSNPRSQEPKEVQQFLDRLVGQAAQSIASDHVQILNGATGEVDGHRVAKLGLRDDSGDLCLIVINGELNLTGMPSATDPRFHEAKFQGMNSVAWTENGTTMILSGDRSCESLIDTVLHKVIR